MSNGAKERDMDRERIITDLRVMVEADTQHLVKALERGDRTEAHGFVDAIIDNCRMLEDLGASPKQ